MMAFVKKIVKRGISIIRQLPMFGQYLKLSLAQFFKSVPKSAKTIVFTLDDDRLYRDNDGSGRYAYMTLNLFNENGYTVYLRKNMNFCTFKELGKYGRLIYTIENLKIISHFPEKTDRMIYAFDTYVPEAVGLPWARKIYVNVLKSTEYVLGNMISIPYYFHPLMYRNKQHKSVHTHRSYARNIRLFVGGNFTDQYYDNQALGKYYGQMTRREGLRALLTLGEQVESYDDAGQFQRRISAGEEIQKCLILQTDHTFPIRPNDWLGIMGKAKFFVCLSGTDLPMCHNAIESLAVGTIPIIAYPDWFFPPLEDGKNALIYSGPEELIAKINEAMNMPEEKRKEMSANAIEYFEQYLTPESFDKRFIEQNSGTDTIMLHPRFNCTERDAKEGAKVFSQIESNKHCYA